MTLLAESQTGKCAYYNEYGDRYLFESPRAHRHYIVMMTIAWLLGYCSYPLNG
jgi:hypothetical protein